MTQERNSEKNCGQITDVPVSWKEEPTDEGQGCTWSKPAQRGADGGHSRASNHGEIQEKTQ